MSVHIDISVLLSYLSSTGNLALSSRDFFRKVTSNGFPIRTSKAGLSLDNVVFYKLLGFPVDKWLREEVFVAITDEKTKDLQLLLDHKAELETQDKLGFTPLMLAAADGKIESIELLLEHKANVETKNRLGDTAMSWACWAGRVNCIRVLLEYGAVVSPGLRERYSQNLEFAENLLLEL